MLLPGKSWEIMGIIPTGKEKGFYLRSWGIFPQIPSGSSSGDAPNPKWGKTGKISEKQEKNSRKPGKKFQKKRKKSQKKRKFEFIPTPHAALRGFLAPNSQKTPQIKRQEIRDQALNPSREKQGAGNTPTPSHMEFSWI